MSEVNGHFKAMAVGVEDKAMHSALCGPILEYVRALNAIRKVCLWKREDIREGFG